jgi:hypothetical protein
VESLPKSGPNTPVITNQMMTTNMAMAKGLRDFWAAFVGMDSEDLSGFLGA